MTRLNKAGFLPTRWSLIAAVRGGDSVLAQEALGTLCQAYWYPLYAYVRRVGHVAEDAADITQGFFAHLIEKSVFARATPERGRLRSFLLASMQRFIRDDYRRQQRLRRGGGATPWSIDGAAAEGYYICEPVETATPETLYHRRWALALLERTLFGLRDDYARQGKGELFEHLKPVLTEDTDPRSTTATTIGERLGMSPAAVRVAVCRLRARYRQRLLTEVAASMEARTEAEVEEEIAALFRALE